MADGSRGKEKRKKYWERPARKRPERLVSSQLTRNITELIKPCRPSRLVMESAIGVLVSQFKAYAGSDGSSDTLSREEFHRLLTSELPNFVKNASDPAAIDLLMSSLDKNNDGELNFLEFWQLIGRLASKHGEFSQ